MASATVYVRWESTDLLTLGVTVALLVIIVASVALAT